MKKARIPLLVALGITVIGIILGSFFDLSISSKIASPDSIIGLTISAIGPTIGFLGVAAMGGGFLAFAIKGKYHIALKILFIVLAAACLAVSIIYPSGEYFGLNGFYGAAPKWVGYLVVLLPECSAMVGGYFLFKDCENKYAWIVFCIVIAILLIALALVIPVLKDIMHRPRYRIVSTTEISFHNWWEPCKDYEKLMAIWNTPKENFKSYPSGHTAEASILLVCFTMLPVADPRFKKAQSPLFYSACCLVVLVALARILAAAHYLSDVSWGAFIMIALLTIANEIVMRIKILQTNE